MTVEELRALIDDVTLGTEIVFMISGTAAEFRPYEFWSETETPAVIGTFISSAPRPSTSALSLSNSCIFPSVST